MRLVSRKNVIIVATGLTLLAFVVAAVRGQGADAAVEPGLSDALNAIASSLVASNGAAGAEGAPAGEPVAAPAQGDTIELHVKDTDLSAVLKLLADQKKLNFVAGKDVTGKVTADLYGVTIDEALKAVLEMNGYGYRRVGNFVYIYTQEQIAAMAESEAVRETRVFTLNYLNVDEAKELVKPVLSKTAVVATTSRAQGGIPSGGDTVGAESYSGLDRLVITDFVDRLEQVKALLTQIDVRPKQVLVEATILQVTLDDECSLGVDFNILAGIDFREVTLAAGMGVSNPNGVVAGATATQNQIPFGRVGTTGFATPGTGFQVGVITNDVSFFVQALEEVSDVNVMSNPKVLALNKQRAEVIVGERLGYRTTTTTTTSEIEDIEFLDTGTQLQFRPFISEDGFIRMEIHPEVSTGDISALGLPSERTTEVTCNIMVRDGHTVVIGGLFDETTQIDKAMVPGLGNLPGVGALFRRDHQTTLRREIIVLLTPHIIDDGEANAEGHETMEYVERTVTGLRSRFPLYTREKLTQIHLAEAETHYNRYLVTGDAEDRNRALWFLKLARHVAPNNHEVHKLIDNLEAQQTSKRPRLAVESVLWKRMLEHGMFENLPSKVPSDRPVVPRKDKTSSGKTLWPWKKNPSSKGDEQ